MDVKKCDRCGEVYEPPPVPTSTARWLDIDAKWRCYLVFASLVSLEEKNNIAAMYGADCPVVYLQRDICSKCYNAMLLSISKQTIQTDQLRQLVDSP